MAIRLITPPAVMPVTLAEAKAHCRVEPDWLRDDDTFDALIAAATAQAETRLNRRLITQTWELLLEEWPADGCITVPYGRLQSIVSIGYTDAAGSAHVLDSDNYAARTATLLGQAVLLPDYSWPTAELYAVEPIVVRFICGYGASAADVPADIRHAIKLMVADGYEFRESSVIGTITAAMQTSMAVDNLIRPYRIWSMPL